MKRRRWKLWNKIFELLKDREDIEFTGKYFRYKGFNLNQKDCVMIFEITENPKRPILLYVIPKNYSPFRLIYRGLPLETLGRITYDIRKYFGDI